MRNTFIIILLIISVNNFSFPQSNNVSPLNGRLLLSLEGGITIPKTDYENSKLSPFGMGAVEYYFKLQSQSSFGFRINGGAGTLKGTDDRHFPNEYSDNIFFLGGGVIYNYALDDHFLPYLFLGASNIWYNPKDNNGKAIITTKPASENLSQINYNGELGIKIIINKSFAFNISGGEFLSAGDELDGVNAGKHNDVFLYGTVGFSISFLGETDSDGDGVFDSKDACPRTPPGVKVDLLGCPLDSDKDGVPDYIDRCAGTPSGVKVDDQGCPIDSDHDGVPDYMDNCPDSPKGIPVDALGCARDSDNDGVPDYKDKCGNTPAGIKVDIDGCPQEINKTGIQDQPEINGKKETISVLKIEKPKYDLINEYDVGDMIFTDGNLYTAQISAWKTKEKANSQADKLVGKGYNAFVEEKFIQKFDRTWYRVRVGFFNTFKEADDIAKKLR